MKKSYFNALFAMLCMGMAFVMAACSDKEATVEELAALGSADDMVVISGHASDILDNAACVAGAEGIELSPALQKIMDGGASPREKVEFGKVLKIRGVDFSNCFYKMTRGQDYVLAAGLTDAKAFREWIVSDMEVGEPEKAEGYDVFDLDERAKLFVNNAAAYLVYRDKGKCDVEYFNLLKQKAAEKPLAAWQTELLAQKKTCVAITAANYFFNEMAKEGVSLPKCDEIERIKDGFAVITANLYGNKFNITLTMRDAEGLDVKVFDQLKNIDLAVLNYANKGDILAGAVSLSGDIDWKELINAIDIQTDGSITKGANRAVVNKVVEVLGNVDGTVFVSAHPKDLLRMAQGPQYWNATIGAQMKAGAAAGYIKEITSLASGYGISVSTSGNSKVINLDPFTFYLADVDGMLVISTQPINGIGGSILIKDYFQNRFFGLEATLAEGTNLGVATLSFQPVIALSANGESASFDVEFIGGGTRLLETLFGAIAEQM